MPADCSEERHEGEQRGPAKCLCFIISKADNSISGSYGFVGLFFFSPSVSLFLPAWQSAGAAEPGLQDGALALAASHRASLDLIHAVVQTFPVRLVSGG